MSCSLGWGVCAFILVIYRPAALDVPLRLPPEMSGFTDTIPGRHLLHELLNRALDITLGDYSPVLARAQLNTFN